MALPLILHLEIEPDRCGCLCVTRPLNQEAFTSASFGEQPLSPTVLRWFGSSKKNSYTVGLGLYQESGIREEFGERLPLIFRDGKVSLPVVRLGREFEGKRRP
jgi:hypothetical protein